jgi:hypothetical protein
MNRDQDPEDRQRLVDEEPDHGIYAVARDPPVAAVHSHSGDADHVPTIGRGAALSIGVDHQLRSGESRTGPGAAALGAGCAP